MREEISSELRIRVLDRDKHTCRYCGAKNTPFHLDHVYPVVKGGETTYNNLVTACVKCNSKKQASVGLWPKPIGYFENKPKPNISILTVFLVSLGLGLLGVGFNNLLQEHFEISKAFIFLGMLSSLFGFGRLATER